MGRIIFIALMFYAVTAQASWWSSAWWEPRYRQQQKSIQQEVITKCERDIEYWEKRVAENPDNGAAKYYLEQTRERCEQEKQQYNEKWQK